MRKLFLTMMTGLGFAVMANAQADKSDMMLGENVAYDYFKVVDVLMSAICNSSDK